MSANVRSESGSPVAASTPPRATRWLSRSDGWIAIAFFLVALVVFNANLRVISTGDSLSSRYVPISLWAYGTTAVDPVARLARDGHVEHYWMTLSHGEFISTYSLVTPLLVTPLYAPAALYLHSVGWVEEAIRGVAKVMEKLSASFVAALSVGLMFVLLRRRVAPGPAVLLTFAYAFGTSTWMISSQALWQHGPAQLFVVVGLLVVTGSSSPMRPTRAMALAVAVGLLVANRLQDLPLALGFVAFASVALRDRRSTLILVAGVAIALGAAIAYNTYTFGSPIGGYSRVGEGSRTFDHPLWAGLSGMLFSPGRGLLAYAPFFAFLVLRFRRTHDAPRFGRLDLCLGTGVLLL